MFNVWAFLLGPIYFASLGLWKRGVSLTLIAVALSLIIDRLFGEAASRAFGFGAAAVFAMTVNYYRFIKVAHGRDEWNPLADLFTAGAPSSADVRRP